MTATCPVGVRWSPTDVPASICAAGMRKLSMGVSGSPRIRRHRRHLMLVTPAAKTITAPKYRYGMREGRLAGHGRAKETPCRRLETSGKPGDGTAKRAGVPTTQILFFNEFHRFAGVCRTERTCQARRTNRSLGITPSSAWLSAEPRIPTSRRRYSCYDRVCGPSRCPSRATECL
jgi:hypothetical protein